MKAVVIESFGGPEIFSEKEVAKPEVRPGHLLVHVAATSVNPLDCKMRSGAFSSFTPPFPAVLHGDVAGTVIAVGEGVDRFVIGDRVYGCAGGVDSYPGALAEFMLVDADLMGYCPKALSFHEAAALPLVALTAWEVLVDRIQVKEGQKVLIHGGTGGVGHVALQLAKWRGAEVFTTVSTKQKAEIVRKLGADGIIFYKEESVEHYVARCTGGKGFDVVFDTVGSANLDQSIAAIAPYGHVGTILAPGEHNLYPLFLKNGTLHTEIMLTPLISGEGRAAHGRIMDEIAKLVDSGKIQPLIDQSSYTIRQVAEAHAKLESGKAIGKIVLGSAWG